MMDGLMMFRLVLLKEAKSFIKSLPDDVADKIFFNINKARYGLKDVETFKKLNADIWEFRTQYMGKAYRLFAFWDRRTETLVIATHGMIKKTQKTPAKEIAKAERIRKEYIESQSK